MSEKESKEKHVPEYLSYGNVRYRNPEYDKQPKEEKIEYACDDGIAMNIGIVGKDEAGAIMKDGEWTIPYPEPQTRFVGVPTKKEDENND